MTSESVSGSPESGAVEGAKGKRRLGLILMVLLVDLLGFALVVPLLPRYAKAAGFSATQLSLLLSAYPFCQLFAGPILGRLSDRFGRRPVLIASQMGTTFSFLILAVTRRFDLMLLARMIDGASGGNIIVAQAYVADVTLPKDRAKSFGLIGMVFGLGFILGPTLGGILSGVEIGESSVRVPFLAAAMFSAISWLLVLTRLPESRNPALHMGTESRVIGRQGVRAVLTDRRLQMLVLASGLLVFGWSSLEGTFSLFLEMRMGYSLRQASLAFAFLGVVGVFVQGFLVRKLVARFGEKKLVVAGMVILITGFLLMTQVDSVASLCATLIVVGVGHGMASPSLTGLISRSCSPEIQGSVFGTLSSAQTLARMTNFALAVQLLARFGAGAPYVSGAVTLAFALIFTKIGIARLNSPASATKPEQSVADGS